MVVPTFAAMAADASVVATPASCSSVEHVAMLLGMLGVMLAAPRRVHAPPRSARPRVLQLDGDRLTTARIDFAP